MRGLRVFFVFVLVLSGGLTARADDVLTVADRLARLHLPYVYGSGDVHNGGLDCSGFIQVVFREATGLELPDEADKQMEFCRAHGQIWDSDSLWTTATLQPGDLIFFAGPDQVQRLSKVSHVMIYAGRGLMVGAQGRGRQIDGTLTGVGYYRFPAPHPAGIWGESGERFIGHLKVFAYGRLPTSGPASSSRNPAEKLPLPGATLKPLAADSHYD